jgi:hypothetical protein
VTFAQECPAPAPLAHVESRLAAAERAWGELDTDGFTVAMDEAALALPCVRELVAAPVAARFHRLQGLGLFAAREDARAAAAFASARAADPDYEFPTSLVPAEHAIRDLYARLPLDATGKEPVPPAKHGALRFDGVEGNARPVGRPTLVQVLDAKDRVEATAWLSPTDPMPAYDAGPMPRAPGGAHGLAPGQVALFGGAAAGAAGAGVLYALSLRSEAVYQADHENWALADIEAQRAETNGLVSGAGVSLAIGAGAALAAVVIPW